MREVLRVERIDSAWTFTLNRPEKMNALSSELVEALIENIVAAHAHSARLLVFKGEGKNFSAGFDFSALDRSSDGDLLLRFVRLEMLLNIIASSPCATLALAHGRNFGAGVDLIAVCSRRVCTGDATFRMPGLKFGLVLGTRRFAALVGRDVARGIFETSRTFDAAEGNAIGFVNGVKEAADWPQVVDEAGAAAAALPDVSRALLYRAVSDEMPDADLALLVRSAAAPGLKDRIRDYVQTKG